MTIMESTMIEWQPVVLALLGVVCTALGWYLKSLTQDVKLISSRVNSVEIDLPTNYVRRQDFDNHILRLERVQAEAIHRIEMSQSSSTDRIEAKFDKLFDLISKKADRP